MPLAIFAKRAMSDSFRATQLIWLAPSLCSAKSADLAVAPEPIMTPVSIALAWISVIASIKPSTSVLYA